MKFDAKMEGLGGENVDFVLVFKGFQRFQLFAKSMKNDAKIDAKIDAKRGPKTIKNRPLDARGLHF